MNITKNLFWVAVDRAGFTGLQFLGNVILARMLIPEDFGVFSLTILFVSLSCMLVDAGMAGYLIKKKTPTSDDFSTLFTVNFLVAVFLYAIIWLISPQIEVIYKKDNFSDILRVISIVVIIRSIAIVQICHLQREFKFKEYAVINIGSYLLSIIVSIYLAYVGYGYWALIVQQIVFAILQTVLITIYVRYWPSIAIHKKSLKEMFSFGSRLLLSSILNVVYNDALGLIIGKAFGLRSAGNFYQSKKISNAPASVFSAIFDRATFPILARIDDEEKFKILASKVNRIVFLFSFPFMLWTTILAGVIVEMVLGSQWIQIVPILRILCISVLFQIVESSGRNILKSLGKVQLILKYEVIKKLIGFVLLFSILSYGINWVAYSILVTYIIGALINTVVISKNSPYNAKVQINDFLETLVLGILSVIPVFTLNSFVHINGFLELAISYVIQLVCILLIGLMFGLKELSFLKQAFRR